MPVLPRQTCKFTKRPGVPRTTICYLSNFKHQNSPFAFETPASPSKSRSKRTSVCRVNTKCACPPATVGIKRALGDRPTYASGDGGRRGKSHSASSVLNWASDAATWPIRCLLRLAHIPRVRKTGGAARIPTSAALLQNGRGQREEWPVAAAERGYRAAVYHKYSKEKE